MTNSNTKVVGLGNAIVDILVHTDDETLKRHGLTKGGMHLVDEDAAWALYEDVGPATEGSGGSVANTIAHIAGAGLPCTFLGKVSDDTLGKVFTHDLTALGAEVPVAKNTGDTATGRSIVMITPDGQRTMSTYLGAAVSLDAQDIDPALDGTFGVLLIEGYLWDAPDGQAAIAAATRKAKACDAKVALTLSDSECILRHIESMRSFVEDHVDIVFANKDEARALARAATDDDALRYLRQNVLLATVTHSEKGSTIAAGNSVTAVPPVSVDTVVDTTGAGDAYAAAFLARYLKRQDLGECGRAASAHAAKVIQHVGAREMEQARLAS